MRRCGVGEKLEMTLLIFAKVVESLISNMKRIFVDSEWINILLNFFNQNSSDRLWFGLKGIESLE